MPSPVSLPDTDGMPTVIVDGTAYPFPTQEAADRFEAANTLDEIEAETSGA